MCCLRWHQDGDTIKNNSLVVRETMDNDPFKKEKPMAETSRYYSLIRKILIHLISGGSFLISVIINSSPMKFYTMVPDLPAVPAQAGPSRCRAELERL
jgi:hypothetical protein